MIKKAITRLLKYVASLILKDELKNLQQAIQYTNTEVKYELVTALPENIFNVQVNALPKMVINGTSTELQAAFLVGQQATVDHFRKTLVRG